MSDDTEDPDHLKTASETTRLAVVGLFFGLYHSILGVNEYIKNTHYSIRAIITGSIFLGFVEVVNIIGGAIFTTFWGQAVYVSGLRLRLLPVPLSLVIYILLITFLAFGFSMDSSIRDLQSELDEVKSELEEMKDE